MGFNEDVTYQHPLFVNNSNNNYYFTNYSTYNRFVSTNDHRNSKLTVSLIHVIKLRMDICQTESTGI